MTIQTSSNLQLALSTLTHEQVARVYLGKKRGCMCGCLGSYAPRNEQPLAFFKRLTRMRAALAHALNGGALKELDLTSSYVYIEEEGGKVLCAYLEKDSPLNVVEVQ